MSVPAPEALPLNAAASRTGVKDVLVRSTLRLQSDGKLVELLRDGFTPAFDVMVERYRLPLTRYCARMVGPDNADDVVQDTFTASFTALASDDRPVQLKPWLYRVAHNTAISALRKSGRQEHEELDENFGGVTQPHEQLEQTQRLHDLVADMRALPERQRAALVLQELEGLTPEEIADELDGSVPMVRQLVHRARERLRNGVGMLIPLPLILKLFGAQDAAAATKAGTAAASKSAGASIGGIGVTGSGAKLAVVLTVGALAGGGVAVHRATQDPVIPDWNAAASEQTAARVLAELSRTPAGSRPRSVAAGGTSAAPSHAAVDPSPAGDPNSGGDEQTSNSPAEESAPASPGGDTTPNPNNEQSGGGGNGSNPAQPPASEAPAGSGDGPGGEVTQPSGDGSQPSSGSETPPSSGSETPPTGAGGGTPPSGNGGKGHCKQIIGYICNAK